MRGSTSNWWNGGGEDSVHSSVVAPSPHGLSPATRLRDEGLEHAVEEDQHADAGDVGADRRDLVPAGEGIGIVDVAARHALQAEEVLREEDQVDADEHDPEVQSCRGVSLYCSPHIFANQ